MKKRITKFIPNLIALLILTQSSICSAQQKTSDFVIGLSDRELDTLKLIAEDLTNQEIADKLFKLLPILSTTLSLFLIDYNYSYDDVNTC
jgi:FixJ family two-component response regulator